MYKSDLLKEKHFSSENILKDSFKTFSWKEFLALIKLKDSMRFFFLSVLLLLLVCFCIKIAS